MASARAWVRTAGGLALTVRLTPKAGRDVIEGLAQLADGGSALKVRVRAPPFEGQANAALLGLIAQTLGVPARDVRLVGGAGARLKRLLIAGPADALGARLDEICTMENAPKR
jgi:uncharacterized protein